MTHTPDQALSLWCPMVRHEGEVGPFNRPAANSNPTNADAPVDGITKPITEQKYGCHCVADKCAMWRWAPTGTSHREERIIHDYPGLKRITHVVVPDTPTHGFCGMAGKPLT